MTWLGIISRAPTLGKWKLNFQPLKEEIRFTQRRDQIFHPCPVKWLTMKLNSSSPHTEGYCRWASQRGKCHGNKLCFIFECAVYLHIHAKTACLPFSPRCSWNCILYTGSIYPVKGMGNTAAKQKCQWGLVQTTHSNKLGVLFPPQPFGILLSLLIAFPVFKSVLNAGVQDINSRDSWGHSIVNSWLKFLCYFTSIPGV